MDIKEIRERRERLQKDIAAAIEEFERLTTLDVRGIKLHKCLFGCLTPSIPVTRSYSVELDTPI